MGFSNDLLSEAQDEQFVQMEISGPVNVWIVYCQANLSVVQGTDI